MRLKTELSERPQSFTVDREKDQAVIVFYTDIQEVQKDEGVAYTAIAWDLKMPWQENLQSRIAEELDSWRQIAESEAYSLASSEARAIRDRLLSESDASMALDRLGLTVPSGSTFTSWLSFLRGIGDVLKGGMAAYRQALRDLPEQEGFPYEITWPERP